MNTLCFFVSDLHGKENRYNKLFSIIEERKPEYVFITGDLLPGAMMELRTPAPVQAGFLSAFVEPRLRRLRDQLGSRYPQIIMILGNDDGKLAERAALQLEEAELWHYAHNRKRKIGGFIVYGYSYVPPTPFLLKDWERYDVSRYTDPGCIPPEEGKRTIPISEQEARWSTIAGDLNTLCADDDLSNALMLFHSPPYQTALDRAALDGRTLDGVPLDVHVGSIAIQRFIQERQPFVTMHGHVHESTRLTGLWNEKIGRTLCMNAAHDGQELSLISFSLEDPEDAERSLI